MEVNFDKPTDDPKDDSDDKAHETGEWCKVCEIKVPRGYVTCPKCHARLPGAPAVRAATGTTTLAGARRPSWFLLLLAMAGAGAIYYHFVADSSTDGPGHYKRTAATSHQTETAGDGGVDEVAAADESDAGPPATAEERDAALTELVDALGAVDIDATAVALAGDEGVIVLRSESCDAKELADVLSEAEETLAQANFHSARCFSPGGLLTYKSTW